MTWQVYGEKNDFDESLYKPYGYLLSHPPSAEAEAANYINDTSITD